MSDLEQAARQALDALERNVQNKYPHQRSEAKQLGIAAITALRAALAQQSEPVDKELTKTAPEVDKEQEELLVMQYIALCDAMRYSERKDELTSPEEHAESLVAEIERLEARERGREIYRGLNIQAPPDAKPKQAEPVVWPMIATADSVFHRPSREWWTVAYVRGDKLSACGWPETIADRNDCLLVTKATPAERLGLLREMSKSTGNRAAYARDQLAQAEPVAEPVADDCTPNHFCGYRWIHKPSGELCNRCGHD